MSDAKQSQINRVERLQDLWLQHMEDMLNNGSITSTDMATLYRFFAQNGWTVDPTKLPKGLSGILTKNVDPKRFEEDDADVIPFPREARG